MLQNNSNLIDDSFEIFPKVSRYYNIVFCNANCSQNTSKHSIKTFKNKNGEYNI